MRNYYLDQPYDQIETKPEPLSPALQLSYDFI